MSAIKSNLTDSKYGYDFVVATTQDSINTTMKNYLYNNEFPLVRMYWNQDEKGNPVPVSYDTLMKQTKGTDPLKVQNWNNSKPMTKDIENINNSDFYFAFEAAIGIPPDILPNKIPNIVTFKENSQSVIFNLLTSSFTIVSCNFGRNGMTSFTNVAQPSDALWMFTSSTDLKNIFSNNDLPKNVQDQLRNLGPNAFSVQQLIFDFDNAALQSVPTISGVEPGSTAYMLLSQVFQGAYFSAMKAAGQPVLNYSIVQTAPVTKTSMNLTNMNLEISPYVDSSTRKKDKPGLDTMNYLCATDGHKLPNAVQFDWNWVESNEASQFNGCISVNRNTFRDYIESVLTPIVSKNCYQPTVEVNLEGLGVSYMEYLDGDQKPDEIKKPASGNEVLQYSYYRHAYDNAGFQGAMGSMTIDTTTKATVNFKGNQIIIMQYLKIYCEVRSLQSRCKWNPVEKTITDTYTISVGMNGELVTSLESKIDDKRQPVPEKGFIQDIFTQVNALANKADEWNTDFTESNFTDLPVNTARKFIFPGGNTFTFKDVKFSEHQDLISNITYVQPKN